MPANQNHDIAIVVERLDVNTLQWEHFQHTTLNKVLRDIDPTLRGRLSAPEASLNESGRSRLSLLENYCHELGYSGFLDALAHWSAVAASTQASSSLRQTKGLDDRTARDSLVPYSNKMNHESDSPSDWTGYKSTPRTQPRNPRHDGSTYSKHSAMAKASSGKGTRPHNWTPAQRHVIHIGFGEYGLSSSDLTRIFLHLFADTFAGEIVPDATRLQSEWIGRDHPGRSSMWQREIDKLHYTPEQQQARALARQQIEQAARALNIDAAEQEYSAADVSRTEPAIEPRSSMGEAIVDMQEATVTGSIAGKAWTAEEDRAVLQGIQSGLSGKEVIARLPPGSTRTLSMVYNRKYALLRQKKDLHDLVSSETLDVYRPLKAKGRPAGRQRVHGSKSCKTCRDRHIKCDGERPVCKNCTRSSKHCKGYQDRKGFSDSTYENQPVLDGNAHSTTHTVVDQPMHDAADSVSAATSPEQTSAGAANVSVLDLCMADDDSDEESETFVKFGLDGANLEDKRTLLSEETVSTETDAPRASQQGVVAAYTSTTSKQSLEQDLEGVRSDALDLRDEHAAPASSAAGDTVQRNDDILVSDVAAASEKETSTQVGMPASPSSSRTGGIPYTEEEIELLFKLKDEYDLHWDRIAECFPGRSKGSLTGTYYAKVGRH